MYSSRKFGPPLADIQVFIPIFLFLNFLFIWIRFVEMSINKTYHVRIEKFCIKSYFIRTSSNFWCQLHQHFTRSFHARRSQSAKKTDNLSVFFTLLRSACVKAVRKMLMKHTHHHDGAQTSDIFLPMKTLSNNFARFFILHDKL